MAGKQAGDEAYLLRSLLPQQHSRRARARLRIGSHLEVDDLGNVHKNSSETQVLFILPQQDGMRTKGRMWLRLDIREFRLRMRSHLEIWYLGSNYSAVEMNKASTAELRLSSILNLRD